PVAPTKQVPVIDTEVPPASGPKLGSMSVMEMSGVNVKFEGADVPPGVVTVTPTVAGTCTGLTAVICVALFTTKLAAGVVPKLTAVAPVKFVPVMTTEVPPDSGPLSGTSPVIVGTMPVEPAFGPTLALARPTRASAPAAPTPMV